jgi:hypothetical protein
VDGAGAIDAADYALARACLHRVVIESGMAERYRLEGITIGKGQIDRFEDRRHEKSEDGLPLSAARSTLSEHG